MNSFFYDNITQARSYPIKEISKAECKKDHRDKLTNDCKTQLPIIKNANYSKYKEDKLMKLTYSILRWASYSNGRDITIWSHDWVDIISAEWTPVYAIEDGEVVKAGSAIWYWNVVILKHKIDNKVIYSTYWHLEKVLTKEKLAIKEWEQIGTMWHEWMARGNNLHLTLDTTTKNTYTFMGCLNYPKIGDYDIIEKWLCRDLLYERTVDPIKFLESNWSKSPWIESSQIWINKTNIKETSKQTTPNITTTMIKVWSKQKDRFLDNNTISVVSNFWWGIKKWGSSTLAIQVLGKNGEKNSNILDKEITITPTKNNITISPRVIRYISDWQVISFVEWKEKGNTDLIVSYWDIVIWKINVIVD